MLRAAAPTPAGLTGHDVQFYESEEFLFGCVADFLSAGARVGQPLIVIATHVHAIALVEALRATGVNVDELIAQDELVLIDARETLKAFMEGPHPNRELFTTSVGNVIERVLKRRQYLVVRAYGEMVEVLWNDGNIEGAIELEELWNEPGEQYSFSLLCAYSMDSFFKEAHTGSFRRICDQHAHAVPTEAFMLADEPERLRQIALLQQRARALEHEVKRRRDAEAAPADAKVERVATS